MAIIVYDSIRKLEEQACALDDEASYHRYFFALYNCSPDADNWTNTFRRLQARDNPNNVGTVGKYFVLTGEPAVAVLIDHYYTVARDPLLSERLHEYALAKVDSIQEKHRRYGTLPIPILLTEGQLSSDDELDFYLCIALLNGQLRA